MSKSVSIAYPWSDKNFSNVLVWRNTYVTFNSLFKMLNAPMNVLKEGLKGKIVHQIPEHGMYTDFVHLKHVKEYIQALNWEDEEVEEAMSQLGYKEPEVTATSSVHATKKRERAVPSSIEDIFEQNDDDAQKQQKLDRQKVEVSKVQEMALSMLKPAPKGPVAQESVAKAPAAKAPVKSAEAVAENVAQAPPPAAAAVVPDYALQIIKDNQEMILAKAIMLYMSGEEFKTRVAAAVAFRKMQVKEKLKQKVRERFYEEWSKQQYEKEFESAKKQALEERRMNQAREAKRLQDLVQLQRNQV